MKTVVAAAAIALQLLIAGVASACDLPQPKGEVILTIEGMIKGCSDGAEIHLDRAMVDALPQREIRTENPWNQGSSTYEGVLLRDLMKYVKADGKTATIVALNDYRADLALADMDKYDVILASKRDGVDLPVREKGPFFVIFPFTDVPELATESRFAQSVWQVNRIVIK